jgi:hypothetical protein
MRTYNGCPKAVSGKERKIHFHTQWFDYSLCVSRRARRVAMVSLLTCVLFMDRFLPNVMMSHAVAWRGGCAAASVTSNRIGSIYWLGVLLQQVVRMERICQDGGG